MNTDVSQENKKLISSNSTQHQKTWTPLNVNDSIRLHNGKTWAITGKINTNDTNNEWNNENRNNSSPVRTCLGRRVTRPVPYNDHVTSQLYKYLKGEILCYYTLCSSFLCSTIFVYVLPSILPSCHVVLK